MSIPSIGRWLAALSLTCLAALALAQNPQIPVPLRIVDSEIETAFLRAPGSPSVLATGPAPVVLDWDFGADGAGRYAVTDQGGIITVEVRAISGASSGTRRRHDVFVELDVPDLGDPMTTLAFRLIDQEQTMASSLPRYRVATFYESAILGPAVKFPFEQFDLLISPGANIAGSSSVVSFVAGDTVRLHLTGSGGFRLDGTGGTIQHTIMAVALTGSAFHPPATPKPFKLHLGF